jgi:hypothetical protein
VWLLGSSSSRQKLYKVVGFFFSDLSLCAHLFFLAIHVQNSWKKASRVFNPAIFFLSQTQKKICKNTNQKKGFPSATIKQIPNPLQRSKTLCRRKVSQSVLGCFFLYFGLLPNPTTLLNHSFTPSLQTLQTLNNQTHHSFSSQIPKTHIHFYKLTTTTTHFAIKTIATRTTHLQQNFIAPKSISTRPIATTTTTHLQQNHCNKIHLETTHDTLRDDDAAAAPRVQFNLNDQVFQIFAFLLLAKDPVTLLRSSEK